MKPEASLPLPWKIDKNIAGFTGIRAANNAIVHGTEHPECLDYIVHACNAYPKLISILQRGSVINLGFAPDYNLKDLARDCRGLLRELGEI
jgi:hypothetical protein